MHASLPETVVTAAGLSPRMELTNQGIGVDDSTADDKLMVVVRFHHPLPRQLIKVELGKEVGSNGRTA